MHTLGRGGLILPGGVSGGLSPSQSVEATLEVKQWGALVGWLRRKDFTPQRVREIVEAYESGENREDEKKEEENQEQDQDRDSKNCGDPTQEKGD